MMWRLLSAIGKKCQQKLLIGQQFTGVSAETLFERVSQCLRCRDQRVHNLHSTRFLHPYRTKPVLLPVLSRRSSALWLQVLKHSSSPFPSQAMHPPPPAHGPPPEGRDWRGRKKMEETMRVLTINELMRLTRIELSDLVDADHKRATEIPGQARRNAPTR